MHKISLTQLGIAGAIQAINNYFETVAPIPFRIKEAVDPTPAPTEEADTVVQPKPAILPDAWKQPCASCGLKTGFQSEIPPHHIWCVTNRCDDYRTVFTIEEWQERGVKAQNERASNAEY